MSLNPQTGEQLIGLSEWNEMVTAHNAVEDAALAATALADAAVAPAELTAAIETERTAERLNQSATYLSQAPGTGLTEGATKAELDAETTARTTADGLRLLTADAPELIRDTIGTALVAGTNVTITPNDVGDTITIAAAAGGGGDATVIQVAAPTGTASTDTANVQAALTTAAAATGTTSRVVKLAPGQYELNAQLNVGARTLLVGAGRRTTTLRWATDLGAGQYGIKNSGAWNQSDAPAFEQFTMSGPATLPVTYGTQSVNMRGIQLGRNSTMTDCFVTAFGPGGVEMYGDHQVLTRVKVSNCFYNVFYPSATPTHGDQTYIDANIDGAAMACIAIEAGNAIDSSEFFGGHCGVAPFGILKLDVGGASLLDGNFRGAVQNTVLQGFSFEDIGNSAIFDESTATGGGANTLLEVTMVNVGFSYKTTTRIAARPKDYAVKARNIDRVRIVGGAFPFTAGDVSVFYADFVGPLTLMQNTVPSNLFGSTGSGSGGFVVVDTGQALARVMTASGTILQGDLLEFAGGAYQVQRYGTNSGKGFAGVAAADAANSRVPVYTEGVVKVNTETCTNSGQVMGSGTTLAYQATEVPNTPNSSGGNPAAPTSALVFGVSIEPKNGTRTLVRLNGSHGTPQAGHVRPTRLTALPTASATYRGQMLVTQGANGVADLLNVCLKSAADTYSWKTISTG